MTAVDYSAALTAIRQHTQHQPRVGLVLGSGLGSLVDAIEAPQAIPYTAIPGWPTSTVQGHSGQLVFGRLAGQPVVVQQGRAHFYEGYSLQQVTFPVRVLAQLGVTTLVVTNAAGGLNPAFSVPGVMLITDHLNLVGLASNNPLVGPNDERFGLRFPSMTRAYDLELQAHARAVAQAEGVPLHEGVYAGISGPMFETPAEVRMLRLLGADAVGMSTVNEVVVARHAGLRVLAFSGITNAGIDDNLAEVPGPNHEEVLEAGRTLARMMAQLVAGVLGRL